MNTKRIAREWLYFLGSFFFGLLVLPSLMLVVARFFTHPTDSAASELLSAFYSGLMKRRDALITWLVVFAPYLIFQFVRSVIWAFKTARRH